MVKPMKKIQMEIASMAMNAMCFRTSDVCCSIMIVMGDPAVLEGDVLSPDERA